MMIESYVSKAVQMMIVGSKMEIMGDRSQVFNMGDKMRSRKLNIIPC